MTEEKKQTKKKVYVETTVVSDATALPSQEKRYDEGLEEIWRIKREIGAEYLTWEAYAAGILAFQEEERKRGVKFVRFPSRRPEREMA